MDQWAQTTETLWSWDCSSMARHTARDALPTPAAVAPLRSWKMARWLWMAMDAYGDEVLQCAKRVYCCEVDIWQYMHLPFSSTRVEIWRCIWTLSNYLVIALPKFIWTSDWIHHGMIGMCSVDQFTGIERALDWANGFRNAALNCGVLAHSC